MSSLTKNERNRKWYAANRKRERQKRKNYYYANRSARLLYEQERKKKKHGVVFDAFIISQNGRCAICKKFLFEPRIDHDHKTGFVRGLLCDFCNLGLGQFFDSVELLENAAQYLKENENGKENIKYRVTY